MNICTVFNRGLVLGSISGLSSRLVLVNYSLCISGPSFNYKPKALINITQEERSRGR